MDIMEVFNKKVKRMMEQHEHEQWLELMYSKMTIEEKRETEEYVSKKRTEMQNMSFNEMRNYLSKEVNKTK